MKLKQKFAIGLCVFYTLSVIGIAFSLHFCGGKLSSVAINAHQTSCKFCKTAPLEKKDSNCCKNTKIDIKVKDSHETVASVKLAEISSTDLFLAQYYATALTLFSLNHKQAFLIKAPPSAVKPAIYLLNCVFRN